MRFLSIDFDAFFPTPPPSESGTAESWVMDWGALDSEVHLMDAIWAVRGLQFLDSGLKLPRTSGEDAGFWGRVTLSPEASCCYADSHRCAAILPDLEDFQSCTEVVHFDAHHDGGYPANPCEGLSCDNWTSAWSCPITMIYPRWAAWKLEGEPEPLVPMRRVVDDGRHLGYFERVFVCRSSGWVPPWCEQAFWDFLAACSARRFLNLDGMVPREWDPDRSERVGRDVRELWQERQA